MTFLTYVNKGGYKVPKKESYYMRKKREQAEAKAREEEQKRKLRRSQGRRISRIDIYYDHGTTPTRYEPLTEAALNNILKYIQGELSK